MPFGVYGRSNTTTVLTLFLSAVVACFVRPTRADIVEYHFGPGTMASFSGGDPWSLGGDFVSGPAFQVTVRIENSSVDQQPFGGYDFGISSLNATINGTDAVADVSNSVLRFRDGFFDEIEFVNVKLTYNGTQLAFPLYVFLDQSAFSFNQSPSLPPMWSGLKTIQGTSGPDAARVAFDPIVATGSASIAVVPEPSTLLMVGVGAVLVAFKARTKQMHGLRRSAVT